MADVIDINSFKTKVSSEMLAVADEMLKGAAKRVELLAKPLMTEIHEMQGSSGARVNDYDLVRWGVCGTLYRISLDMPIVLNAVTPELALKCFEGLGGIYLAHLKKLEAEFIKKGRT